MTTVTPTEWLIAFLLVTSVALTVLALLALFGWKFIAATVRNLRASEEDPS